MKSKTNILALILILVLSAYAVFSTVQTKKQVSAAEAYRAELAAVLKSKEKEYAVLKSELFSGTEEERLMRDRKSVV